MMEKYPQPYEIGWLAKASLIARVAAVVSRRASDSVSAFQLAYRRSPEIPHGAEWPDIIDIHTSLSIRVTRGSAKIPGYPIDGNR